MIKILIVIRTIILKIRYMASINIHGFVNIPVSTEITIE